MIYQSYKDVKKQARIAVAISQKDANTELYNDLEKPEGVQRIFKIATQRKNMCRSKIH